MTIHTIGAAVLSLLMSTNVCAQDVSAAIDEGRDLRLSGNVDQSIDVLRSAASKDPKNFRAQYNLALALAQTSQKAEADTAFKTALDANGQQNVPDPTIYNSYGWFLLQNGKFDAAEKQFDEGLKHLDDLPVDSRKRLLNNSGVLYLQTGRLDKARALFQQSSSLMGSAGAERSLQVIRSIEKSDASKAASVKKGLIYLGQSKDSADAWLPGSATTSAAAPSELHAGQQLKLTQSLNVHEDKSTGGTPLPGSAIGTFNSGEVVKVKDFHHSDAKTGGSYFWATVEKSDTQPPAD